MDEMLDGIWNERIKHKKTKKPGLNHFIKKIICDKL